MRNPTRQNPFTCSCAPPPCSTSASLARPLAPGVTFTVDHTSFLSPCCTASSPPFSLCPPNAANPPTPAAHPAYTLHPRSLRPSSLHPAGNGDSTMQSLHSAITAPCNHLLWSIRRLPNSPSLRLPNKSTSQQVGKLASAPPPGSPPARLIVHTSSHPRPAPPLPRGGKPKTHPRRSPPNLTPPPLFLPLAPHPALEPATAPSERPHETNQGHALDAY